MPQLLKDSKHFGGICPSVASVFIPSNFYHHALTKLLAASERFQVLGDNALKKLNEAVVNKILGT